AYNQSITSSGGTGPYSFALTAGALPAGIALDSSGTIAGTPTAGGTFNITVTATDSSAGSYTGSTNYTLTIDPPTIAVAPTTLAHAQVGAAYSQTLTASGGTPPYSFAVTAGALPPGLSLSAGALIPRPPTPPRPFSL